MDKTILVEERINKGKNFLENLKNKHIKINDALWVFDEEVGYWKLIITSPIVKKKGSLHFYKLIGKIIKDTIMPIIMDVIINASLFAAGNTQTYLLKNSIETYIIIPLYKNKCMKR